MQRLPGVHVRQPVTELKPARASLKTVDGGQHLIDRFQGRRSKELVIAFAGPIGCDIPSVVVHTKALLLDMGYVDVVHVKLSAFIRSAIDDGLVRVSLDEADQTPPAHLRIRELQEGGKALRRDTSNTAILAEYAAKQIRLDRDTRKTIPAAQLPLPDDGRPVEPGRVAYLIDQVKRPEEVALLRAIYRRLFYLVGVTRIADRRTAALRTKHIPEDKIARLMELDRNEGDDNGQRLEQTLHMADYFLRNDAPVDSIKREKVKRLLGLIHGDTSISPTDQEHGMYAAYAAGLRSACLSRQVGAAIADGSGEVIATGCNDVPRAGGGLYGASRDRIDHRCVHHEAQYCFNDHYKTELQGQIRLRLETAISHWPDEVKRKLSGGAIEHLLEDIYRNTRLGSLIEFSRSVHAEMDAIISAARNATAGLVGGTLYTTTFPCHSCARHIVAAGITSVYYIEPYEKSLAKDLHADSIGFEVEETSGTTAPAKVERVAFLHFEGVSPRQYQHFFKAGQRKISGSGTVVRFDTRNSEKVVPEYLDNYQDFETKAIEHFSREVEGLKPDPVDNPGP